MTDLEFGYFDDYHRLRADVLSAARGSESGRGPAAIVVAGFDDRCFACRQSACRCSANAATAEPGEATDPAEAAPAEPTPPPIVSTVIPQPTRPKPAGCWAGLFRDSPAAKTAVSVPLVSHAAAFAASPPRLSPQRACARLRRFSRVG